MLILKQIKECRSQPELIDLLWDYFKGSGFNGIAYMVPSSTDPLKMIVDWRGFPACYVEEYIENDLHLIDPFPAVVARHANAMRFSEISRYAKLTAAQSAYIEQTVRLGLTDGFIIPTFGIKHRMAKFALGQVEDESVLDAADIDEIIAILQAAHRQLDQLERRGKPLRARLGRREVEILHWIARGKTNAEIASILGVSAATISTYLQRIFEKLQVTDRASAAAKAINFGIVAV